MKVAKIDLTGQVINHLTVIGRSESYLSKMYKWDNKWRCQCECGNVVMVKTGRLNNEPLKVSCGCKSNRGRVPLTVNKNRSKNVYLQRGNLIKA